MLLVTCPLPPLLLLLLLLPLLPPPLLPSPTRPEVRAGSSHVAGSQAIVRGNWEASAKKGKLSAAAVEGLVGRVSTTTRYEDLATADVVVEAAFERMDIKREIFGKLDAICKP